MLQTHCVNVLCSPNTLLILNKSARTHKDMVSCASSNIGLNNYFESSKTLNLPKPYRVYPLNFNIFFRPTVSMFSVVQIRSSSSTSLQGHTKIWYLVQVQTLDLIITLNLPKLCLPKPYRVYPLNFNIFFMTFP